MRETKFIEQNKEKWSHFEQLLQNPSRGDAEKLSELFIQVTDDLSFSRTFYPNRSVRVYLNDLAQQIFLRIYKSRKSPAKRLLNFWTDELPRLVYEARRDFRLAFFVFAASVLIGLLSSAMDPEFVRTILGDRYVQMTQENIDSGDPMAVYKQKGQFQMALGITLNNVYVSFITFLLGALFFVGTLSILVYHGIMIGAFQYFFVERDLFWESFLTIWMHGTLEISAIVIAGAAGLTMGRGLVFPGTYRRVQAFQQSARRGLKILLGTLPLFVIAGFIEGLLTRYTDAPDLLRGVFILACLLFVIGYFAIYPVYKARRGFAASLPDSRLSPDRQEAFSTRQIYSSGELFARVFSWYGRHLGKAAFFCLLTAAVYTVLLFLPADRLPSEIMFFPDRLFGTMSRLDQFFRNPLAPGLPAVWFVLLTALLAFAGRLVLLETRPERPRHAWQWLRDLLSAALPAALLTGILALGNWLGVLLFLGVGAFVLLWAFASLEQNRTPGAAFRLAFSLVPGSTAMLAGLFFSLLFLGLVVFNIADSPLMRNYLSLVSWIVALEQDALDQVVTVLLTFVNSFVLHLFFLTLSLGIGLAFYSLREINQAVGLRTAIQKVGTAKTFRGLERE